MKTKIALLAALVLIAPSILPATDLDPQTLNAWDEYIQSMKSRTSPFLWIDEVPGWRERVREGDILAEPADKDSPRKVPHGLIHHWVGSVFIPNTSIEQVYTMLNDYARYNKFYGPVVVNAKLLEGPGRRQRFSMELLEKTPFVTTAVDADFLAQTVRMDEDHWYTTISGTRIQQIDGYGHPDEHSLPPDKGTGYVWRIYAIQRFEAGDGGVFAECEVMVLSRDVPLGLEWLVKPILQHLPRNAMEAVLLKTREAVCAETILKAQANGPAKPKVLARSLAAEK